MSDEKQVVVTAEPAFSLVPRTFKEAMDIASVLAKSQLVPKDYQGRPENVFVAVQWGQELGLAPLQSLQGIAVINGRPAIWGDAALALCQSRPDFQDIEEKLVGVGDERKAICVIKRKGRTPTVVEFSVADARTAGLWDKGGPWKQYPDRMLQMRARGFALRNAFADAMKGFKTAEEVQDYQDPVDITPNGPATRVTDGVDTVTGEVLKKDEKPELPQYPSADFADNWPKWVALVDAGRQSWANIKKNLASKHTLSAEQINWLDNPETFKQEQQA